jgi:serine/threonine protein kinase
MPTQPAFLYRLLDKDYYETLDSYVPRKADLCESVSGLLPSGWQMWQQGIWFHCGAPDNVVPQQGWKIHVSATPLNAKEILERVSSVLFRRADTNFKFVVDLSVLFLINSKNWSRSGSGKFITIYPADNARFLEVIEELYQATTGIEGPYILSDHRYKDSRVVFYRYGGMRLHTVLNITGERMPVLIGPGGTEFPDQRAAYPTTPSWAEPPLPLNESNFGNDLCLKQDRYRIDSVLVFSNAGGVYRALDRHTGNTVVIKEARPCINSFDEHDAVQLLKKEHRLLQAIEHTGIAPRPLDLFQEWEHWFLVQEFVDGTSMGAHAAESSILLRTRPSPDSYQQWYETFRSLCLDLIRIVDVLHQHNIIFSDLSTSNLIVLSGSAKLKIVDFEGAFQLGTDRPAALYTPGFISQDRLNGSQAAFEDDYYAMGAVLMAYLFPVNLFFHLKPEAIFEFMASIQRDARLPEAVAQMILSLLSPSGSARPVPAEMVRVLEAATTVAEEMPKPISALDYSAVIEDIVVHINSTATYSRQDRLFPADSRLFATNPLSVAYGAAGVGHALSKITGHCQSEIIDWILRHDIAADKYTPGLYLGSSGIAWSLLEMGALDKAEKTFQHTLDHRLLAQASDVFYGIAGWGLTCLRFFLETGDESYLEKAIYAGNQLVDTSIEDDSGCCWQNGGQLRLGFAHGASGVALFLLYLYLATGRQQFLRVGERALDFDLSFAVPTRDGGLSWRQSPAGNSPVYPYWKFGSAGIGAVLLRYHRLLGLDRYRSILDKIWIDTDRKYAVFPGRFLGLAGIGDFLLDMHQFLREDQYLQSAHRVAESLMHFRVERHGATFPGDMLSRLSCDYGTGSAGIALFLRRLTTGGPGEFRLDSFFDGRQTEHVNLLLSKGSGSPCPGRRRLISYSTSELVAEC